jgi:phage terminase large subunit-like protein
MIRALLDPSPDALIAKALRDRFGRDGARRIITTVCSRFSNVELAALAARWETWARPKQMPPANWLSWGNLAARGWGKSATCAKIITAEVMAGRVSVVTMAAQNMTKTEDVQVTGLINAAPPWFRPVYESSREQLVWPNGARAFAFTPEVPDAIRSPNANLAWLSELQSWPKATREEAYSNFLFSTRVGGSRMIWDATPKKGHPILKRLLARAEAHPTKHFVVRGSIYENPHLDKSAVETMELDYAGTRKGREELLGEMLADDENAIFKQEWIDASRRGWPEALKRRIIVVDPSITSNPKYSDETGIVDMGLGVDGQVYALANMSGVHRIDEWPGKVVDAYVRGRCDLIWVENNRGGEAWEALIRVAVRDRKMTLVVLGKDTPSPGHNPSVVYMRAINAKRSKAFRAEGAAALCERGRVSFVVGKLGNLEERLCLFEGREGEPDGEVDAFVHGCHELADLGKDQADGKAAFQGITEIGARLTGPTAPTNITTLLGGIGGGRI